MYVCMHACMHVCRYVCKHVYMYIHLYMYTTCLCIYGHLWTSHPFCFKKPVPALACSEALQHADALRGNLEAALEVLRPAAAGSVVADQKTHGKNGQLPT